MILYLSSKGFLRRKSLFMECNKMKKIYVFYKKLVFVTNAKEINTLILISVDAKLVECAIFNRLHI